MSQGPSLHRLLSYIEIWGLLLAYVGMAIATQRIAHMKGRNAEAWLFYGLLLPGVSLIHALRISRPKSPSTRNE